MRPYGPVLTAFRRIGVVLQVVPNRALCRNEFIRFRGGCPYFQRAEIKVNIRAVGPALMKLYRYSVASLFQHGQVRDLELIVNRSTRVCSSILQIL